MHQWRQMNLVKLRHLFSQRVVFRRNPNQTPKPQLTPLDAEKQPVYSECPHWVKKLLTKHQLVSCILVPDPYLMTIGESWNVNGALN